MENRKGNGIFLGIVSIATLIVAIIGATFAYFSASTESEENAVSLEAYEFKLNLSVSQVWEFATGLIPLDPSMIIPNATAPNNTNLAYAINVGNQAGKKCVDDNGLQVCAMYAVEITNAAVNPVTLTGQIKTIANNPGTEENATPFANLTYQEVTGTPETGFTTIGQPISFDHDVEGTIDIAEITVPGATSDGTPGKATTYVLVYLNDNGNDQSSEMGATYQGQLIYTSEGGSGNTLTGTFRVSGTTEEPESGE